jgi:hypothetical protein
MPEPTVTVRMKENGTLVQGGLARAPLGFGDLP